MGVRNDLDAKPRFPDPLAYSYSVSEALGWPSGVIGGGSVDVDGPAPTVMSHNRLHTQSEMSLPVRLVDHHGATNGEASDETAADMAPYAVGAEWEKLRQGKSSDKYFNLIRASGSAPSPTVTAEGGNPSIASVAHPTEKRKFTIGELQLPRRLHANGDVFSAVGAPGPRGAPAHDAGRGQVREGDTGRS